jgi:hypothetical protein
MKKLFILLTLFTLVAANAQGDNAALINPFEGLEAYTPKNDSIIIKRYLAKLNALLDRYGNPADSKKTYQNGAVTYAPDDTFKLFIFKGTYCDKGLCDETVYSVTQYATGKVEENSGHSPIVSMYKLGEGRYLTIGSLGLTAPSKGSALTLSITTTHNYKTDIEPLFTTDPDWATANYGGYYFKIVNPDWAPTERFYLRYDPETYMVSYSYTYFYGYGRDYPDYIPKVVQPKNQNEAVQVTGGFMLKQGKSTGFKEQYESITISGK